MRTILFLLALMMLVAISQSVCWSQSWEELPETGTTLDFSGIFNAKATALGGQAIHAEKVGWIGVQGSQIAGDGEVLSQDIAGRVQGGFDTFLGVNLQGFVEANRDMNTDLTLSTGAYLRYVLAFEKLKFVLGGGSLVAREDIRAEVGLDETAPEVLPYWLTIVGVEYDFSETIDVYGKVVGKPELNLSSFAGILDAGLDIVLSDDLTLKVAMQGEVAISQQGLSLSDTENSVILSLNF